VQNQTNATDMKKIFKIHDNLYCGLAGLATDMQTLCAPARIARTRSSCARSLRAAHALACAVACSCACVFALCNQP
jgi:20S proteasome alpha/beta subunit